MINLIELVAGTSKGALWRITVTVSQYIDFYIRINFMSFNLYVKEKFDTIHERKIYPKQ